MYNNDCGNPWIFLIRHILDSCGFSFIWTEQYNALTKFTVQWSSSANHIVVSVNDRNCTLCNTCKLADKFHYSRVQISLNFTKMISSYQVLPQTKYSKITRTVDDKLKKKIQKKLSTFILKIQEQVFCPA